MLIETITSQELETREKLLLTLYYLGMADKNQLATILNRTVYTITTTIQRLNKKDPDEKHIISVSAPFQKGSKMYQLGPAGWKWVMAFLELDRKYYERSDAQKRHYRGMTDILVRLVKELGHERLNRISYHNTYEASEKFRYPWEAIYHDLDEKEKRERMNDLPEPDLMITYGEDSCWVEYDVGTEGSTFIHDKNRRYFRAYKQLSKSSISHKPIVWIAMTKSRADRLKVWAEMVASEPEFKDIKFPPQMFFLVEGEEIPFLLRQSHTNRELKSS